MQEGLVSVILPIYNVEKYLARCLNSVVSQTYTNLEILLIDDGSTDDCPRLCDEWALRDRRIKVIHKRNAGLGMARNTGIEHATGKYICFVDSDDYIVPGMVETAYQHASRENADIVTFGFHRFSRTGKRISTQIPRTDKALYIGKEVQEIFLPDLIGSDPKTGITTQLYMSAWASLYSMELIQRNHWRFVSEREIISEDVYSLLVLYQHVNIAAILPEALYCYCENDTSLTQTFRRDRYEKIKLFYQSCIELQIALDYNHTVRERLATPYLSFTIAAMKQIAAADCRKEEKKEALKRILSDEELQAVLHKIAPEKEPLTRKIILTAMKKKMYGTCYILLVLKSR